MAVTERIKTAKLQNGGIKMDENRVSDYVLIFMKNLNFVIILYIAVLMAYSLSGYIQEGSAYEFLMKIDSIPLTAKKLLTMVLCLYCSVMLLMCIRNVNGAGLAGKVFLEIGICILLSYILGFSYTGTLLLVLADMMKWFSKSKWRFPFAVLICMFYLLMDFHLLTAYYNMVPLETYLEYFRTDVRLGLLGIINILSSLNTFVFLVYMILLVRTELSEKDKILNLNDRLNTANTELKQANMQLEEYAKESVKMAQTRERNRLAREIHDTLGHALTGIITGIEACTALMDVAPEATKVQLKAIAEVARQGITDVRRSVKALRPDALEKFDLEKALLRTVEEMCTATSAKIDYECTARLNGFNEDEEDIIYRIVQESITNAIRHGKADQISIRLDREYNMLKIHIKDNGIGCKTIQKGFGLHHMEERLNMLHGSLAYDGMEGFLVEAQIPIRWGTEEGS